MHQIFQHLHPLQPNQLCKLHSNQHNLHSRTWSTRTTNGISKLVTFQTMNFHENQKKMQKFIYLELNDWMNAHHFLEGIKVNRFCLTLVGEARLWYESLTPINVDWQVLQNLFGQYCSKMGNTREQLFHAWRSFHFDENTETIDAYVTCIRQVATL